jgi:hypothetical protein
MNLDTILLWEDKLAIRRSVVLFVTLWMTWRAFEWAATYAVTQSAQIQGIAAAAIIAAVTAPITALQGWIFKLYNDSKQI